MNPAAACRPDRDIPGTGRGRHDPPRPVTAARRRTRDGSRRIAEYYRLAEENPADSRVIFRVGVIFRDDDGPGRSRRDRRD